MIDPRVHDFEPRIIGIMDDIDNHFKLTRILKELQQELSPYDYERIRFAFQLISRFEPDEPVSKKGMMIIDLLKGYCRRNGPTSTELASTMKRISVDAVFESQQLLANKRLPYHDTILDPWAVLEPELNEETIPRLLPLTIALGLESDQVYLVVVNNLISRAVSSRQDFWMMTFVENR